MIFSARSQTAGMRQPGLRLLRSALVLLTFGAGVAQAQTIDARISVVSLAPARVRVEGERAVSSRRWSFRNAYASVNNLADRIENLSLTDEHGANVTARKLAPGEYAAEESVKHFSYEVKLDAPPNDGDAAYVSWLNAARGVLMLGDLLPLPIAENEISPPEVAVHFALPLEWKIASLESKRENNSFATKDAARAVFYIGHDLRERRLQVGGMSLALIAAGEWAFTDEDVSQMAGDILREHLTTQGGAAQASAALIVSPFPRAVGAGRWSAETRGGTTFLLLGHAPSRTAALAQLSVPLAHELFHLWIPNGLALDGNYDWFYEGFTQYQALQTCVRLGLLTFQDYLNAVGGAFDAYRAIARRDELSLVDASARRWTGAPGLVYNKGLLTAFLYDLTLRQQTDGKRSLSDVYKELFRRYRSPQTRTDGNIAVVKALNGAGAMEEFTRLYIENPRAIDLAAAIAPFGLNVAEGAVRTRLTPSDSPSRKQRDLLRKIGYNSEARARTQRAR
ncbi:MAG: hypothetical protein ABR577_13550 [Pyrinomonadaceae bacterium]